MDDAHPLVFLHTLFIDKLRELYRTSLVLFYLWFVGYLKFCKPYYCLSCIRIPYLQVGDESVCMTARIPERMWNCWKYKFSHKMKLPTKYGSYKIYVRKTNTERPKFICDLYRKRHHRSRNHHCIFVKFLELKSRSIVSLPLDLDSISVLHVLLNYFISVI